MVQAINFAVRDSAGGKQQGAVAGDGQGNFIQVGSGDSISLNLAKESVVAYEQQGNDLVVKLSDGRAVVLSNYFHEGEASHLYISSEGEMTEVLVQQGSDGALFADYGPVSGWDKWSPLDDLRFTTADSVSDAVYAANEPAGMAPFIPGLLGGFGGAGAAAAALGAAAVIGGTSGGGSDSTPDTTPPVVAINKGTETVNHVETAAEYTNGVQIGGTSEAGAAISVLVNGNTQTTTAGADGTWEVTFPQSQVTSGQYTTPVVVTATDAAGNSATATDTLVVDTVVQPFTHTYTNTSSLVVDNVLNNAEAAQGLTVGGTVESGSSVQVRLGDGSYHTATVVDGAWSYTFAAGEVTSGDLHSMPITAIATDKYGNVSAPINSTVAVDTLVSNFAHTRSETSANLADAILNKVEADSGLTVGGTVEPGSSVMVKLDNGSYHAATVVGGVWSYTFAPTEISTGDMHTVKLTAVATDGVGNVSAPISSDIKVDTLVSNLHSTSTPLAGDGVLNAAEAAAGMTVSGTAEVGAHILVHMQNGSEMTTTAGANGAWSVVFSAAQLPSGEGAGAQSSLTVTATDIAGNVAHYDQSFTYDTVAPADPWITNDAGTGNLISGIAISATDDAVTYHSVAASGGAQQLQVVSNFDAPVDVHGTSVASEWTFFTNPVQDGSYLVVRDTDAVGNESSTLYIRSTTGETTVDLSRSGLSGFDFGTIDLSASHASLTLTAAQLNALTGPDKSMTIAGGADDHVTLVGATDTNTTQTIHGETYHVFTMGTQGASVLIDSDIIINHTGV